MLDIGTLQTDTINLSTGKYGTPEVFNQFVICPRFQDFFETRFVANDAVGITKHRPQTLCKYDEPSRVEGYVFACHELELVIFTNVSYILRRYTSDKYTANM